MDESKPPEATQDESAPSPSSSSPASQSSTNASATAAQIAQTASAQTAATAQTANVIQPVSVPAAVQTQVPTSTQNATMDPADPAKDASKPPEKEKKIFFTWDRSLDILKLVATVWVALLGSVVTMQFNERQHELNRIEAIAQMLPHMSEDGKSKAGQEDHMGRDGAIWAIFRTANNRKMLRDLAALFPEDIYRVVSSIAIGGELEHDSDALVALQVSSEKLATQYSSDPNKAEAASKLYAQALALKTRSPDDSTPLRVLDLTTTTANSKPSDDQMANLVKSINDLADQHLKDIETPTAKQKQKSGGSHWESKQLYLRARKLGTDNKDEQVQEQVMRADLALARLYVNDQLADDGYAYFKEALECEAAITKTPITAHLKALDKDGDGFAALGEVSQGIIAAQKRFDAILSDYKDKGADLTGAGR